MTRVIPGIDETLTKLQSLADPAVRASQARFGITGTNALGITLPALRGLAKGIRDHELALALWESGIHEARTLAAMIEEPSQVTREQAEHWVTQFDSWDICDIITDEVLIHTPFILELIEAWSIREEEFVKRAAFASMAALVVHRKDIPDQQVVRFFDLIEKTSTDPRNFVKKAVNWALRNIGKYRPLLRQQAWTLAEKLSQSKDKTAHWIGRDAVEEFELKFGGNDEAETSF